MDIPVDVLKLKLAALGIIWMAACPFYFTYKGYDVNKKTVTVMMFPLIMFLVWFLLFWWG